MVFKNGRPSKIKKGPQEKNESPPSDIPTVPQFLLLEVRQAERAKRELDRTCADEDLLAELASTAATLANLRNHATELERSITAHCQLTSAPPPTNS